MRGEVISSIELVLPENVVEAAYTIPRQVETKFQAINADEGTSSEITVFKLMDDSVKINITVTTIDPEDIDDFPVNKGFVETPRREDAEISFVLKEGPEQEKNKLEPTPDCQEDGITEKLEVEKSSVTMGVTEKIEEESESNEEPVPEKDAAAPKIHQRLTRQGIITTIVHPKTPGSGRKKSVSFCPSVGDKGLEGRADKSQESGKDAVKEQKSEVKDTPNQKVTYNSEEKIENIGNNDEVKPENKMQCIDMPEVEERIEEQNTETLKDEIIAPLFRVQLGNEKIQSQSEENKKQNINGDSKSESIQASIDDIKNGKPVVTARPVPSRPRHLLGVWRPKKKGIIRKVHTPSNSAVYVVSKTGETPPHFPESFLSGMSKPPVYQSGLTSISEYEDMQDDESEQSQQHGGDDKNLPQKKRAAARVIDVQLDHRDMSGQTSVITLPSYQNYQTEGSGITQVIHIPVAKESKPFLISGNNEVKSGKRKYKREHIVACLLCDVKVKDHGYLFRHVKNVHREHPEMKEYLEEIRPLMRTPCPICGKMVSSIGNISSHIKQCHSSEESAVHCPVCNKMYKTSVSLRQHLRQCHQPHQKRFTCPRCPAVFTERRSLQEHINCTHETTEVFNCEDCGKSFLARGRLRRHRYIHGEFRHECSYCGKGFHLKDNMNKHVEIVHEKRLGKRFPCKYCGKRFSVKGNMTQHVMGVHLKKFQYECPNCLSGFRRKKELVAHMAKLTCEKVVRDTMQPKTEEQEIEDSNDIEPENDEMQSEMTAQ